MDRVETDLLIWKVSKLHHVDSHWHSLKISPAPIVINLLWCVQTYCRDVGVFEILIDFLYLHAQFSGCVINCK